MYKPKEPWKALEVYKGKYFSGIWPTLPELFNITVDRFPERRCFSVLGGQNNKKSTKKMRVEVKLHFPAYI